ncbi:MAG: serine protease [Lachnospiraceae bacterium]|nr:serine protease [Lachnospiraceae bacterium]
MSEKDPNVQSDFMIEKIKERPVNKGKLVRRMLLTAAMAVIFGLVACFTFLALEPILNGWMNPEKDLPKIYFPEETEEMLPEEMLLENIPDTSLVSSSTEGTDPSEQGSETGEVKLEEEQIQKILSEINLSVVNYRQMYSAMSEYTKNLQKTMVTLTGITSRTDWLNDVNESTNRASGIIIYNNSVDLFILTDYSALENAQRLNVTFCNGAETTAVLKRKDPGTGLAVVTVPIEALPENFLQETIAVAKPGSSNYTNLVGMPVVALGSPMGTVNSAGYGVINSVSGQVFDEDANYKLLQTDIVGSPLADGVLFNLYGQFIGIITHNHSAAGMENLITAYGITDLKKRMEKMSNDQPFSYAGIYGTSVSLSAHEELYVPYGAYVKDIVLDSPAMRAGIQKGDVITQMDEYAITNFSDYVSFLNIKNPETEVRVTILRLAQNGYKEMQVEMTLGELK